MEILKNFGFEPVLFIAQIVNFLIILFILKKLLYKPILGMLKKREETIKEGLQKAEEGQKLFEKSVVKEKEILKKAQDQAKKIADDAKQQALLILQKGESSAKEQTEKIIKEAREQINLEARLVEQRLKEKVSDLAIEFLTKSIKELFGEKEQKELMKNALKKIRA